MSRMHLTRTRRRAAAVALTAVLGMGLSGCGSASAGSAAVVDGRRISVSDLQTATQQVGVYAQQEVAQANVLMLLIVAPTVASMASARGVGVSDDDVRVELASTVKDPSPSTIAVVRANAALQRMTSAGDTDVMQVRDELVKRMASSEVTVNPRYGTFDKTKPAIDPAQTNWLVAPSTR